MPPPSSSACLLSRARLGANLPNHDRQFFRAARKVRRHVAESAALSGSGSWVRPTSVRVLRALVSWGNTSLQLASLEIVFSSVMAVTLSKGQPIQSFASHTRASSRVLKAGNSRREKLLRLSENPGGKFSVPTNPDFLTKGLSKVVVSFKTRKTSGSKDAPVKSVSAKTELRGRVVTTSGSARRVFSTSAAELFDPLEESASPRAL